jgi:hypothetical protein
LVLYERAFSDQIAEPGYVPYGVLLAGKNTVKPCSTDLFLIRFVRAAQVAARMQVTALALFP